MSVAVNVARPGISTTGRRWYAQLWVHVVAGMIGGVLVGHPGKNEGERGEKLGATGTTIAFSETSGQPLDPWWSVAERF